MIAPDTNLLLYAYNELSPHHHQATKYLEGILSATEPVGFVLPVIHSFVRLITNPAISGKAVPLAHALGHVDEWLAFPHVRMLYPGDRHWDYVKRLTKEGHATGNLVPDTVIAAIALEYGAVIHTNDRDFARFPSVRWHNPLKP
ncbi:MAG: PIN domain-containing protein [Acidobacteriota bacterium]|nr:PIN domain-containing protein [Acidobacteriota bacterium]